MGFRVFEWEGGRGQTGLTQGSRHHAPTPQRHISSCPNTLHEACWSWAPPLIECHPLRAPALVHHTACITDSDRGGAERICTRRPGLASLPLGARKELCPPTPLPSAHLFAGRGLACSTFSAPGLGGRPAPGGEKPLQNVYKPHRM